MLLSNYLIFRLKWHYFTKLVCAIAASVQTCKLYINSFCFAMYHLRCIEFSEKMILGAPQASSTIFVSGKKTCSSDRTPLSHATDMVSAKFSVILMIWAALSCSWLHASVTYVTCLTACQLAWCPSLLPFLGLPYLGEWGGEKVWLFPSKCLQSSQAPAGQYEYSN